VIKYFKFAAGAVVAAGVSLLALPGAAQTFPAKVITVVVPQAPGGANDGVARTIVQQVASSQGWQMIVENRPGAGGNIGTAQVARAAADGHTLLLTAQSAHTINPALYRNLPFDPVKDFVPVMTVANAPYLLVVNPTVPVKSLKELIEYAKQRPGQLNYASAGNGTANHLLGEMLKKEAGLDIVHVPYKGAAAAAVDVVSGQVQMTFGSLPGLMPFVRNNQLRALGVATDKPSPLAPGVPALGQDLPALQVNSWYGLFAPRGTPPDVVQKLQAAFAAALEMPALRASLNTQGAEAEPSTSAQLEALLKADLVHWAQIVKDANVKID
jgi:tripartite-type tricarboxylate transporter receptor subunit TctC